MPNVSYTQTLWASLENDNDTADRYENHQRNILIVLNCLESDKKQKWRPEPIKKNQKGIFVPMKFLCGDQNPLKKTGRSEKP